MAEGGAVGSGEGHKWGAGAVTKEKTWAAPPVCLTSLLGVATRSLPGTVRHTIAQRSRTLH